MQIAVFGLGYVGTVCSACLADLGHSVVGVDVSEEKVDRLRQGLSPVVEPGLQDLIGQGVASGRLRATLDPQEAMDGAELAFICVGTPSLPSGGQDRQYVERVASDIGRTLGGRDDYCGVVMRSTVLPGTMEGLVRAHISQHAGATPFGVASNPEFLREGSAIDDFYHPPYTVIGTSDARLAEMLGQLYAPIDAPILTVDTPVAEMLKFVSNTYHALKVAFANEVGAVCKALELDSHAVTDLFIRDTKLNISSKYLRPGFAFGGSCLPKDVRALSHIGRSNELELPLLNSIMRSNELHVGRAVRMIEEAGSKSVGVLGIAFKPGTDDLRESPMVTLCETLLGRGYDLKICDPSVNVALLTGSNKQYIEAQVPHLTRLLLEDPAEVVRQSDSVVISYDIPAFRKAVAEHGAASFVIDLAGVDGVGENAGYTGIAW